MTVLGLSLATVAACGDDGEGMGESASDTDGTDTSPTTGPTSSPTTDPTTGPTTDPTTGPTTDPTGTGTDTMADTGTDTDPTTDTDTEGTQCPVPEDWAAPNWEDNTGDELALQAQLGMLTGADLMRGAEEGTVTVDALSDLTDVYAGTPSLEDITAAGFDPIVQDAFQNFVDLIAAGEQDLINGAGEWDPQNAAGGIFGEGDRGLNAGGIEVRQIVDKGLFSGGAFYNYAVGLTADTIDEATIDSIAAIWGNNAMLDPKGELDDSASYGYQMGFHADMAAALIAAKAHAADPNCEAERDEALVTFFNLWEQSMLARMVYYAAEMNGILVTAKTDTELADGLHELAEGLGLAAGFYGVAHPKSGPLSGNARVITDAEIEEIMTAFGVDLTDLNASTTGEFVESLPNYEAAVETAEGVVMDVYGVDAATIATYRDPTPG